MASDEIRTINPDAGGGCLGSADYGRVAPSDPAKGRGTQTTPPSYRITSVRDFLKVPFDRRRECLREFEVWLQASDSMSALLDGLPVKMPASFVWVDDGLHHFAATVTAGKERIPVVSGTIKGFENG